MLDRVDAAVSMTIILLALALPPIAATEERDPVMDVVTAADVEEVLGSSFAPRIPEAGERADGEPRPLACG